MAGSLLLRARVAKAASGLDEGRYWGLAIAFVMVVGLLVRLPFLWTDFHISGDMAQYLRWARAAEHHGIVHIYRDHGVDYPPLLIYLFNGEAWVGDHIMRSVGDPGLAGLIKLSASIADLATAWLIAQVLRQHGRGISVFACCAYLLNPAVWYVSTYWGQTDAAYALPLVICVVALEYGDGTAQAAWIAYVLALTTKLQSVVLAPLVIAGSLARKGVAETLRAVTIGLCLWAVLVSPWLIGGRAGDIIRVYTSIAEGPRVDVSAYNLWFLLLMGHINRVESGLHPAGLPFSYGEIGVGLFGCLALGVSALAMRRSGSLPLAAATLALGMFVMLPQMHERYMFPTLALLALAAGSSGAKGSRRTALWSVYGLLSVSFLFNLVTIAPFMAGLRISLMAPQDHPAGATPLEYFALLAAALNVSALAWLVFRLASIRTDRWALSN